MNFFGKFYTKSDDSKDKMQFNIAGKKTKRQITIRKLKNELSSWRIARIKYKTMILVLSLLEMRSGDSVIKRIMRALPIDVLKKNMIYVYTNYKEQYGNEYVEDALNHVIN